VRTTFVDVGVDPEASGLVTTPIPDGVLIDLCPRDRCGNPSGWGRKITCGPDPDCTCGPSDIVDHGDGCYTVTVHAAPGAATCTVDGTGKPITVPRAPACLLASETLNPRDRTFVMANVHAGSFSIGNDARIHGSAFGVGDGFLGQRSTIGRDATLGGILEGNRAGVLGTLTENAFVNLPLLVRKSFSVGSGSEVVPNDASVMLSPGLHGNAIWRSRSRVTLAPGTYAFASLEIEPHVMVNAVGAVGALVLNVQGQLNIGDRASLLAESPQSLELYSNASQMRIGTDVVLSAVIVAPDAMVSSPASTRAGMAPFRRALE
jgi:hypothetical protein